MEKYLLIMHEIKLCVYNNHNMRAAMPMLIGPHLAGGLEARGGARRLMSTTADNPTRRYPALDRYFTGRQTQH
jgi:hypothetical protein